MTWRARRSRSRAVISSWTGGAAVAVNATSAGGDAVSTERTSSQASCSGATKTNPGAPEQRGDDHGRTKADRPGGPGEGALRPIRTGWPEKDLAPV
jgi:hypothetical protein